MTFYLYVDINSFNKGFVTYDSEGVQISYDLASLVPSSHEALAGCYKQIAVIERELPSDNHLEDLEFLKSFDDDEFVRSMQLKVLLAELKNLGRHDIVEAINVCN